MNAVGLQRSSSPPRLMRVALAAAEDGHFIFPLAPLTQVPPRNSRDWESAATRDTGQIEQWWSRRPNYNVAIACGPSGLLVVDLDVSHGQRPPPQWAGARGGRDVFTRLVDAAGQPYPDTYTVQSPSGGRHLYFRAPQHPELRNTQGHLGWRIDTRGHGGYIVAAGSVRRDGLYRVVHREPIAELPDWLVVALTPPPAPEPVTLHLPEWQDEAYVDAAVRGEVDNVRNAEVGKRHITLRNAAIKLGRYVGAGRLDKQTADDALYTASSPHFGVQEFTEAEARKTIADGLKYGMDRPRYRT